MYQIHRLPTLSIAIATLSSNNNHCEASFTQSLWHSFNAVDISGHREKGHTNEEFMQCTNNSNVQQIIAISIIKYIPAMSPS